MWRQFMEAAWQVLRHVESTTKQSMILGAVKQQQIVVPADTS